MAKHLHVVRGGQFAWVLVTDSGLRLTYPVQTAQHAVLKDIASELGIDWPCDDSAELQEQNRLLAAECTRLSSTLQLCRCSERREENEALQEAMRRIGSALDDAEVPKRHDGPDYALAYRVEFLADAHAGLREENERLKQEVEVARQHERFTEARCHLGKRLLDQRTAALVKHKAVVDALCGRGNPSTAARWLRGIAQAYHQEAATRAALVNTANALDTLEDLDAEEPEGEGESPPAESSPGVSRGWTEEWGDAVADITDLKNAMRAVQARCNAFSGRLAALEVRQPKESDHA